MATATGVALGVTFLFVFYRAVQLRWPENYFGATDISAYAITASPLRYIAFRFAPVYLTCAFVAVSVDRAGESGGRAAFGVGIGHAVITNGVALWRWFTSGDRERRAREVIALLRAATFVGIAAMAALAALTAPVLAPVIPPVAELAATLWTGLFAGVVGAFLVRISQGTAATEIDLVERSRTSIRRELLDEARIAADDYDTDLALLIAVMVVENIQRPDWFRALERVKGRIIRHGTYGIMQVAAERPLSDEESIAEAARRLQGVSVIGDDGLLDRKRLHAFALSYNGSSNFSALLEAAYQPARLEDEFAAYGE